MDKFTKDRPVPIINLNLCDGCGLCVQACPSKALAIKSEKAVVIKPMACDYRGLCEMICPKQAINRPFEIVFIKKGDLK